MELVYSCDSIESKRTSRGVMAVVLAAHALLLLALVSGHDTLQPIEHPILISLITPESSSENNAAIAPLHPQKTTELPKFVRTAAPEPQLAAKAEAPVPAMVPESKPSAESASHAEPSARQAVREPSSDAPLEQKSVEQKTVEQKTVEQKMEQPKFNADYLDNPSPGYPPLSRKLREEGQVLLRVRVDVLGRPVQVTLHATSGFSRLDDRALDTVRRWKFIPAHQGGQAVEAWVIVPIQFSLKG